MRYVLATEWGVGDERLALLLATLGHALDFQTWRSLVRQQGLSDEQAVEALLRKSFGSPLGNRPEYLEWGAFHQLSETAATEVYRHRKFEHLHPSLWSQS